MKNFLSFFFVFLLYSAQAQWGNNIVSNPDFEIVTTAPTGLGQIALAAGWTNGCGLAWNSGTGMVVTNWQASSDLHGLLWQGADTPTAGAQSNDNFAGFIGSESAGSTGGGTYFPNTNPDAYLESILGELTEPIEACQYLLEFWASQPPLQAHSENIVEVVLRTNNCNDPGILVYSQDLSTGTWEFQSAVISITPVQAAMGYDRIEFRRAIRPPGTPGLSHEIYISVDNISLRKADGPAAYFTTHPAVCNTDAPIDFFKCKPIFWGTTFTASIIATVGGITTVLPAGVGISTYNTSGPNRTNVQFDPTGLSAGTYEVQLCDVGNGGSCCTTITFQVCEPPQMTFSVSPNCDPNATITVNDLNGTASCSAVYTWTTPCGTTTQVGNTYNGCGFGPYVVSADNGVCAATTSNVILYGPPTFTIPPTQTIDLCTWNGALIDPGAVSTGSPIVYSGPGIVGNQFDPSIAGVGSHLITLNSSYLFCDGTETMAITVIESDNWHQTTTNSNGTESQNDVITDSGGNVYIVGTYTGQTDLDGGSVPNITINSNAGLAENNAYIAKYDACGNLIWVAATSDAEYCLGETIAIDEINGVVYIAGDLNGYVEINSSQSFGSLCQSQNTVPLSTNELRGYIAQFDMNTGCLNFAEVVSLGTETSINSLTVNETNGTLYAGGSSWNTTISQDERMMVRKYQPSNTSLLGIYWQLVDNSAVVSSWNRVNDMDFDELSGNIGIIGTFNRSCEISINGTAFTTLFTTGNNDAFIGIFRDAGSTVLNYELRQGNIDGSGRMAGEGISFDPTNGNTFFTGTYIGTCSDPFILNGIGTSSLQNGWNGYMIGINSMNGSGWLSAWSNVARSSTGNGRVEGVDVVAYNQEAHFISNFSSEDMIVSGFALPTAYVGPGPLNRAAIITYDSAGAPIWVTSTEATLSGSEHSSEAIETDRAGHAFVVGSYTGDIDYSLGNPSSGVLVSSTLFDGFTLRSDLNSSGALQRITGENETALTQNNTIAVVAAPNPTSGKTTITLDGLESDSEFEIKLTGMDGRIHTSTTFNEASVEIDLTSLEDGVYIATITDGTQMFYVRIVKAN